MVYPLMIPTVTTGASPSGKAAVFGTAMRRFESFRPKRISTKSFLIKK